MHYHIICEQVWFQNRRMKDKRQRMALTWPYWEPAMLTPFLSSAAPSAAVPAVPICPTAIYPLLPSSLTSLTSPLHVTSPTPERQGSLRPPEFPHVAHHQAETSCLVTHPTLRHCLASCPRDVHQLPKLQHHVLTLPQLNPSNHTSQSQWANLRRDRSFATSSTESKNSSNADQHSDIRISAADNEKTYFSVPLQACDSSVALKKLRDNKIETREAMSSNSRQIVDERPICDSLYSLNNNPSRVQVAPLCMTCVTPCSYPHRQYPLFLPFALNSPLCSSMNSSSQLPLNQLPTLQVKSSLDWPSVSSSGQHDGSSHKQDSLNIELHRNSDKSLTSLQDQTSREAANGVISSSVGDTSDDRHSLGTSVTSTVIQPSLTTTADDFDNYSEVEEQPHSVDSPASPIIVVDQDEINSI